MGSFWRLLGYLRNYKKEVSLNIISNILTALFTAISIPLMIPFLELLFNQEELVLNKPEFAYNLDSLLLSLKYYLSTVIVESREKALLFVCLSIILVFFLKNIFSYLSLFFMAPVRNGIIKDLRQKLFEKVLVLPVSYFSEQKKGDVMSRMTADVQEVEWSILNVLEVVFRAPLIIAGSLAFMLYQSTQLTLFVFALIFFSGVIIGGLGKRLKRSSVEVQERMGGLVSTTDETLSGLRIIKGFNAENFLARKFDHDNLEYKNVLTRLLWRRDLASPMSEFLGISSVAALLWYGSSLVFSGEMKAAPFLTFIIAFYYILDPAKSFSKAFYNIQKGLGALKRVETILDAENTIKDTENPQSITTLDKEIVYQNVSFAYDNSKDTEVLKNINLTIEKGKLIALVGASGAGKSTIADLLPRFYDVEKGAIQIDGVNIKNYRLKDLRALMGIVTQEAVLFNDSVYNNIVFGLEQVTKEQVMEAARVANAHSFILELDQGYDTNIGDRGNKLSGGQRQRITIARAVLKNPDILILDEATSALDSESEQLVQQALSNLMKNRTSIVIAHRLSTIRNAHEIIVLSRGEIVERGTHERLLERGGDYAKLVALQGIERKKNS